MKSVMTAVSVHLETYILADAQIAQLGFLEVGVDPDLADRADGHDLLSGLKIIALVDVPPRDEAVDFGFDRAVAEIQLGYFEVRFGYLRPLLRPA